MVFSLTSLQTWQVKIDVRVVRHACAIMFQLAEVAASGDLLRRIGRQSSSVTTTRDK